MKNDDQQSPEEWEDEEIDPDAEDRPAPKEDPNPDEYAETNEGRTRVQLHGTVSA